MSGHTPGPWQMVIGNSARKFKEAAIWREKKPSDIVELQLAIASVRYPHHAFGLANARLIAASPDLLQALESVWLWMENQADAQSKGGHATFDLMMLREQRDIARAAIAKATGGAA